MKWLGSLPVALCGCFLTPEVAAADEERGTLSEAGDSTTTGDGPSETSVPRPVTVGGESVDPGSSTDSGSSTARTVAPVTGSTDDTGSNSSSGSATGSSSADDTSSGTTSGAAEDCGCPTHDCVPLVCDVPIEGLGNERHLSCIGSTDYGHCAPHARVDSDGPEWELPFVAPHEGRFRFRTYAESGLARRAALALTDSESGDVIVQQPGNLTKCSPTLNTDFGEPDVCDLFDSSILTIDLASGDEIVAVVEVIEGSGPLHLEIDELELPDIESACCEVGLITECLEPGVAVCAGTFDPYCDGTGWDWACIQVAVAACGLSCRI